MENTEKVKNGIIVMLIVIIILLCVLLCFVVKNSKNTNNTPVENTTPEVIDTPETEGQETTPVEEATQKISDTAKQTLFNSLLTPSKEYGLYFGKNVTIDTMDDDDLLEYVLEKYVTEKKINMSNQIDCFIEVIGCESSETSKFGNASKSVIDNYIKTLFNTERVFTPAKVNGMGDAKYRTGNIKGYTTGIYVYDVNAQVYYFGYMAKSGDATKLSHSLVKVEEDETNVYMYTKLNNKTNYKHTFKKANNNYYWTGSEIVK